MIKYGDEARTLPLYSDGRAYRYLGKLDRFETGEGSWCGAVALGAVGDCTRVPGHTGPHQNTATADAFEILPAELTDRHGSYTPGTYSDGRAVRVYGRRDGFAYLAFEGDLGLVTKVPESWVSVVEAPELPAEPGPNPNRCPRCHAPAFAYCLGWCPVGRTADERAKLLHVHVETDSADCDGRQHDGYVDRPREDEDELDFLQRHIGYAVSPYATVAKLRVRQERPTDYDGAPVEVGDGVDPVRVFEWNEATEEGYSARTVRTCHELGCGVDDRGPSAEQLRVREQLATGAVDLDLPWSPRPFSGVRPEDAGL